ncbi:MAG: hypothetical protein H6555_10620 [Lewinellaceae bacterium]|nr:hypothetical protein [Lewinellaceae bacterium]
MIKILWRVLLITAGLLILGFLWIRVSWNQPMPEGVPGPEAEKMAKAILKSINAPAWDTTRWVSWTYRKDHEFIWDRQRNWVSVRWTDKRVLFDAGELTGLAWQENQPLKGNTSRQVVEQAWEIFCNDSYWLNAPAKIMDEGTVRELVTLGDGSKALKVTFSSGGVTPGDTYLWMVDDKNRPTAWRMWVKVLPIGGLEFSWDDWVRLPTGARIATTRRGKVLTIRITDLQAGNSYRDIGLTTDPFRELARR